MNSYLRFSVFMLAGLFGSSFLSAQTTNTQMPQDYWGDGGVSVPISSGDAVSYSLPTGANPFNSIYWAKSGSQIVLMDTNLQIQKTFGSFWNVQGMTCDKTNNLYVLDSDGRVFVYDSNQNLITNFLTGCKNGSGIPYIASIMTNISSTYTNGAYVEYTNYFTNWGTKTITNISGSSSGGSDIVSLTFPISKISINTKSELFICDFGSASVKVFSTNGTLLRSWGGFGIGLTNFATAPWGVQVNPDQTVSVIDNTSVPKNSWQSSANIIKNFDIYGNYLGQSSVGYISMWGWGNSMPLSISPDGLRESPSSLGINKSPIPAVMGGYDLAVWAGNYLPNGDLIILQQKYSSTGSQYQFKILTRNYYGKDLALNLVTPPLPVVKGQSQRPGTSYLDIDYSVIAATNTPVQVGMLAFINGQTNLSSLIIPSTFLENTQTNLGTNLSPNTTRHLTWNVAQDWSTNTGSLQVEFLVNDGRPLQPQMWTYSPTNIPSKLTGTVTDPWSMWLWLLATKDPAVSLQNGTIVGVGGKYDGQSLYAITATNVGMTNTPPYLYTNYTYGTTTNGQQFLLDRVNAKVPLVLSNSVAR